MYIVRVWLCTESGAQCPILAGGFAELLCEFDQRIARADLRAEQWVLLLMRGRGRVVVVARHLDIRPQLVLVQLAPSPFQRVEQHFLVGEVLKESGKVGKRLVERRHVLICLFCEESANAVNNRMRSLMHYNVVREAGEHRLSRQVAPDILRAGAEVAEKNAVRLWTIERVLSEEGVRVDIERIDVLASSSLEIAFAQAPAPVNAASKRLLEMLDGIGYDRIDHLLVEVRISLTRTKSAAKQDIPVVEVDRLVVPLVRAVVVDDGDRIWSKAVAYDWSRFKLLEPDSHRHLVAEELARTRVESIGLERPCDRVFDLHLRFSLCENVRINSSLKPAFPALTIRLIPVHQRRNRCCARSYTLGCTDIQQKTD